MNWNSKVEVSYITPNGEKMMTNMRVQQSDVEAMEFLFTIMKR